MTNSSQLSEQGNLSLTNKQPLPWHQLCLIIFMISGSVGNGLCCYAVVRFKFLRTVPNYFITSLAISDLYMCLIVMPLSIYYSFNERLWFFGNALCYIWNMSQFASIASSIMTLGVISSDRLLSITKPIPYSKVRKPRFAFCIIAGVWLTSMMVFVIFSDTQLLIDNRCMYHPRDGVSRIVVTFIIFWLPLLVVIAVNIGIASVTCKLKRHRRGPVQSHRISPKMPPSTCPRKIMVATVTEGNRVNKPGCSHWVAPASLLPEPIQPSPHKGSHQSQSHNIIKGTAAVKKNNFPSRNQDDVLAAQKRRSYIVIAVVIGAFVVCWMPFFLMTVHITICPQCYQTPEAKFLWAESRWLGYFNSTINPIIYALIKRDYRRAFKLLANRT